MSYSAKIAEAFVDIKANTTSYEKGISGIKMSLGGIAKMATGVGAALGIGVGIVSAIKATTQAFIEEEQAIAKLNAVLASTGNAAGFSSKEMQDFATELQNTTTFADDAIMGAQTLLATFTNIKGDNFKEATKMATEMSTVFGQDLKSSAVQLGKALNDPVKGISALSKVGVSFNDSQKQMIKTMVETGNVAGAQNEILKAMKEQGLDGAAAAMRNTLGGALTGLKLSLEGLGVSIFKALGGAGLTDVVNSFATNIQKVTKWITKVTQTAEFERFVAFIKLAFSEIWLNISTPFRLAIALFKDVYASLKKFIFTPLTEGIKVLGQFSETMMDLGESLATKFADILPDAFANFKQEIKDIAGEHGKNVEDFKKSWADAGKNAEDVSKKVVGAAQAEVEAVKEVSEARKTATTSAEDFLNMAQGYADEGIKMNGVVPNVANVAPTEATTASVDASISKTSDVLANILSAIKDGNKTLTSIDKGITAFSVYA